MASTPSKGSMRAAHAARTKRHAQRTPLPERGETSDRTETLRKAAADVTGKTVCPECGARGSVEGLPGHRLEKHGVQPEAPAAKPRKATSRTFGGDADGLAAQVKEARDSGKMWREIADTLNLGEGKTGTSRARRLYRLASGGTAAPRKAREGSVSRRRSRTGTSETQGDQASGVPMMGRITTYDLAAADTGPKRKGKRRLGPVNVQGITDQQVRSLTRVLEGDGYTVTVAERTAAATEEAS